MRVQSKGLIMGCDIALYFEEKDYTGIWKEVEVKPNNILPEERYYQVWGFLFNVRNEDKWEYTDHPFASRGFPEDCITQDLREDYENTYSDWHSWTYLYANEVDNIKWPEELKDCYFKLFLEYVFPLISSSWERPENIRMIACFHS